MPTNARRPSWPWLAGGAAVAAGLTAAFLATRPAVPVAPGIVARPIAPLVAVVPVVATVPSAPHLTAPLDLFDPAFDKRLRGWNVADPLAWGVSEDTEGFPVAGSAGEIARPLPGVPGRISVRITVPESARSAFIGVRDAQGRTTGLKLWPLNGITAVLSASDAAWVETATAGSAIAAGSPLVVTLAMSAGRMTATIPGAAVALPLVIDLPAAPVAVVLAAEGSKSVFFESLRAEP